MMLRGETHEKSSCFPSATHSLITVISPVDKSGFREVPERGHFHTSSHTNKWESTNNSGLKSLAIAVQNFSLVIFSRKCSCLEKSRCLSPTHYLPVLFISLAYQFIHFFMASFHSFSKPSGSCPVLPREIIFNKTLSPTKGTLVRIILCFPPRTHALQSFSSTRALPDCNSEVYVCSPHGPWPFVPESFGSLMDTDSWAPLHNHWVHVWKWS